MIESLRRLPPELREVVPDSLAYHNDTLDDKKGAPTLDTRKLKADGNVKVTLQPNGGLVLCK